MHFLAIKLAITFLCLTTPLISAEASKTYQMPYNKEAEPVVIIGGGIAGLTAGIYISEANIPCLIIEGPTPGGALTQSASVRNWPGVIDSTGSQIVESVRKQALRSGARILKEKMIGIDFSKHPYVIDLADVLDEKKTRKVTANSLILAMGAEPIRLNVPGEVESKGNWILGISNCAICDGSLYKKKNIAVVGGGDAAISEANYLANLAAQVTILVRKDYMKANDIKAKDRTLSRPNVKIKFDTEITKINSKNNQLISIDTTNSSTKEKRVDAIDGLFLAIGSRPNTSLLNGKLELKSDGTVALKTDQSTSIPGVFAAGDVCDSHYNQAVRSSGEGCTAALQSKQFLEDIGYEPTINQETVVVQEEAAIHNPGIINEPEKKSVNFATQENSKGSRLELGKVHDLNSQDNIQDILSNSSLPIVIDFYATWCGACKQISPVLDDLANSFSGKVAFIKIDIDKFPDLSASIPKKIGGEAIKGLPTVVFIKNNREVNRQTGLLSTQEYKQQINQSFNLK